MLSNAYSLVKYGVDTAENEPLRDSFKIARLQDCKIFISKFGGACLSARGTSVLVRGEDAGVALPAALASRRAARGHPSFVFSC